MFLGDLTPSTGFDLSGIVPKSSGDFASAKPGLCDLGPPVSKGGKVAGTVKDVHSRHLSVYGCGVSSLHELHHERFTLFWRRHVYNALHVLWAKR